MQCDKVQEHLSAYLEDALSPAEKRIIGDHLRSCPKCRKSLADLEMTISSIKGLDEIIPPPWLTQKVMSRVKAEAERKNLWQRLFFPLHIKLPLEAVGLFLVAITALYIFRNMEPELKNVTAPSEETVSEYAPEGKALKPGPKGKRQPQSSAVDLSKRDERTSGIPSLHGSGQPPAPPAEQFMYDKEPSVKEKHSEVQEVPEKEILQKSSPAPARSSAQDELKLERSPQAAGKIASGLSENEDISLSFKVLVIDSAKRDMEEVLSDLDGRGLRENATSDTLTITVELGSDKLLTLMQRLKTLGYVKEKTPTPMSDKDRVMIKITISKQ